MATGSGAWGIDVGQCALKALRCRIEGGEIVADGFDYIEYPKILSQPEANASELVKDALGIFLSRNNLKGDRVGISVGGQLGLAKYFKPPPVDAKKLPDIVKYEARQQIPFSLNDVIWDYQRMGGGAEVDGIMLESEIGLFAMKREQVFKSLQPFQAAEMELDLIQLAPLAIYSAVLYDQMEVSLPDPEQFDPDNPPPSTLTISLGTDATDLLITNGFRLWQRNVPIGGNTFTKQLTKELKLTFAKAEHLKRNAHTAEDPRAVFQAMRPVFNDVVTEIQRSISFFQSVDKRAKITKMIVLGNTCRLPGLKQYLQKHLGFELIELPKFERLGGNDVVGATAFSDNVLSFASSYGLCLQLLGRGTMKTNLIPREILTDRLVRSKRPWAVAGAAALLFGMAGNYIFNYSAYSRTDDSLWANDISSVDRVRQTSTSKTGDDEKNKATLKNLDALGKAVVGERQRRMYWLELNRAINDALPTTPGAKVGDPIDPKVIPFVKQHELHIQYVESKFYDNLTAWAVPAISQKITDQRGSIIDFAYERQVNSANTEKPEFADVDFTKVPGVSTSPVVMKLLKARNITPPTDPPMAKMEGPGYVIEVSGYHYFNPTSPSDPDVRYLAQNHVYRTLLATLLYGECELPEEEPDGTRTMQKYRFSEIGILNPVMTAADERAIPTKITNVNAQDLAEEGAKADGADPLKAKMLPTPGKAKTDGNTYEVNKFRFVVQFAWQERPLAARREARAARLKAAADAAKAAEAAAAAAAAAANPPK